MARSLCMHPVTYNGVFVNPLAINYTRDNYYAL
jgi:hypothetical protein